MCCIPEAELFEMLDIADEMVRFCSVSMPSERYYAVANAIWVIAHRARGRDQDADDLKAELVAARERYLAKRADADDRQPARSEEA